MKAYRGVEVQFHSVLILALDGGERSTTSTGHFIPGKEPQYPLNRWLGGPHSRCGRFFGEQKIRFPLPGIKLHTVHPVASRYTEWAISAYPYLIE
jgi:hypothetical protein